MLLNSILLTLIAAFSSASPPVVDKPAIAYEITFENAVHHEAQVKIKFTDIPAPDFHLIMSRSSPGRYALHEFAKNVFDIRFFDDKGGRLAYTQTAPHRWKVAGHRGTVIVQYTLFANYADGTYSQIDEMHAHLNVPATFAFGEGMTDRPIRLKINTPLSSGWSIATQMKSLGNSEFFAPDLNFFLDSPIEIAKLDRFSFSEKDSRGKSARFEIVLHHDNQKYDSARIINAVRQIVRKATNVFGEHPAFEYGTYTFIICYAPQSAGDGMEHRNSCVISGPFNIDENFNDLCRAVSHEYFHAWNGERIRPASLARFNFEQANMAGELWMVEGFTSYYTWLILCRARIITDTQFVNDLQWPIDEVSASRARSFFTPIEISNRALYDDGAESIDPVNRDNTYLSYYIYGRVLAMALDLTLRNESKLSLDGFMKLLWDRYGREERPYNAKDLENLLAEYSNKSLQSFFSKYIYESNLPDFKKLLTTVGVSYGQIQNPRISIGVITDNSENGVVILFHTLKGTAAYKAGLDRGDIILSINGEAVATADDFSAKESKLNASHEAIIEIRRNGKMKKLSVNPDLIYDTKIEFIQEKSESESQSSVRRKTWLQAQNPTSND